MLIEYEYQKWLIERALELTAEFGAYRELFGYLYSRVYVSKISRDRNREEDGIALRRTFAESHPWYYGIDILLEKPCSVLELMVALAIRCEEDIMYDPEIDDRTGEWLQTMIVSLGLRDETDGYFNEAHCSMVIDRLIAHKYQPNGEGGLFTLTHRHNDLRRVEIWNQMNWYLNELTESQQFEI